MWWLIIIICYVVLNISISISILYEMLNGDGFALSPKAIKELSDLTWLGAIAIFSYMFIFATFMYFICFMYFLFKGSWPEEFE